MGKSIGLVTLLLLCAEPAAGDILTPLKYFKNYQLGVDVGMTTDTATLRYDPAKGYGLYQYCDGEDQCEVKYNSSKEGYGIFIEQPFKRQGKWHFDYDLGMAFRIIDDQMTIVGDDKNWEAPVEDLRLHLYSLVMLPHITFGLTPKGYPDLLMSVGPSGELIWGSMNFDDTRHEVTPRGVFRRTSVQSILSFQELELVINRFGKGALSFVYSNIQGDGYIQDGDFMPEKVNHMKNLTMGLERNFFGLKLLMR